MGRKLLYLTLLVSFFAQSQTIEPKSLFSDVIGRNIKTYTHKSQQAYIDEDYERAGFLFDSLINNVINGSYLDNFKVKKLSGKKAELYDFEKPVFLMTYASWCTPGIGEIPALNKIVEKYHNEIDFVILFWDSKNEVKKSVRDYSSKITILYVDEKDNRHDHVIETMKHSLGFPTSFFIDENKKIVDVRRSVLHPYNEKYTVSFDMNYAYFKNGISLLKNLGADNSDVSYAKEKP